MDSAPYYWTIQKAGNASTLNVIAGIKALLPPIKTTVPPQLDIAPLADQSIFVSWGDQWCRPGNADCRVPDRFHDSRPFLGSGRSTVIIATSIPLAILTSIIVLSAIGETINIMTLGGLALAVGILVTMPPLRSRTLIEIGSWTRQGHG